MKLKTYMLENCIGPSKLAQTLGVNHATVIRYRDGARIPSPAIMLKIVQATDGDVQPNDFFNIPEKAA